MKILMITTMLMVCAICSFTACESQQIETRWLSNDLQRAKIIDSLINRQTYRVELTNTMMLHDSCRLLIVQKIMEEPEMMGLMINDPTQTNNTMDHMINMASVDSAIFNDMIQMMKDKPDMWRMVMKISTNTPQTNKHDAR